MRRVSFASSYVVLDVVLRLLLALLEVDDALLLELVEVLRVLAVPTGVEEIFTHLIFGHASSCVSARTGGLYPKSSKSARYAS